MSFCLRCCILLFFIIGGFATAYSQGKTDSLQKALITGGADSNKVKTLILLAKEFLSGDPKKAFQFAEEALKLSEKINWPKGEGDAYHFMGYAKFINGEFLETSKHWQNVYNIRQRQNDADGISRAISNLGSLYIKLGNYPLALQFLLKGLNLEEQRNNLKGMAISYNNLGSVYYMTFDFEKALECQEKALKLFEQIADSNGISSVYGNMAEIYNRLQEHEKALQYHHKTLKMKEVIGDKRSMASALGNIGNSYVDLKDYPKALDYYHQSLKLKKELNDKNGIALTLSNIGRLYRDQKKYRKAAEIMHNALEIAVETGNKNEQMNIFLDLSFLHEKLNNLSLAMKCYKRHLGLRDTLNSTEQKREMTRNELKYEFDKKSYKDSLDNAEREKVRMVQLNAQAAMLKQEKFIKYILYSGIALLIVFIGFVVNRWQITRRQKQIIETQKSEVETQKNLIQEHQKEIMDSINYAKRIQYALLASDNLLEKHLPEHFVLFRPKDVVSGDFYWATPTKDGFIYVTADCTGHGVPGAFMSLLNISKLSQVINENGITRPGTILNQVRSEIINVLNPEGSVEESKDGMDVIVCKLNVKEMKLEYAAANNSFYIVRNNALLSCKADKMPVGKSHDESTGFTNNEISLKKGDVIYTLTDGFADQFGGPKGKKFKYKPLEELLLSIHALPLPDQSKILEKYFNDWRGTLEQVDDVCIIGVRV